MPNRKAKRPSTPLSDESDGGDDEFLIDPEQIFDILPQPFRLVDKTLNDIFDCAWSLIEKIEEDKAVKLSKESLPNYDCGRPLLDIANPSCICSDKDGRLLYVAHNDGFTVIEALIGQNIATYEDSSAKNVTHMSACSLTSDIFLLASVENDGVGKLFCFCGDQIHLAKVLCDETSKQARVSIIQLSDDGNYVVVGWQGDESWLEVHKVPKESWVKEVETAMQSSKAKKQDSVEIQTGVEETGNPTVDEQDSASHHSTSSGPGSRPESSQGNPGQSSFSKLSGVLRVRPPVSVGPCSATNYAAALKAIDSDSNVFGLSNNHVLMTPYFEHSDLVFKSLNKPLVKYLNGGEMQGKNLSLPNCHFLKAGKLVPTGLETDKNKVNSIAVWWSGGTQVFIYSLVKNVKDLEIKPDVVWPNADQIVTSTISSCLSVLALGMANGTVALWDVYRGVLLRVCSVSSKAAITCMHFLTSDTAHTEDLPSYLSSPLSVANLTVACDDGSFCVVQCGVAYSPPIKHLIDRSALQQNVIRSMCSLPKTPQIIAVCKDNGQITFYDSLSNAAICHASLPHPYTVDASTTPCVAANNKVIVLKGFCPDEDAEDDEPSYISSVFTFPLQSFPSLNRYWRMGIESEPYSTENTIETRLNSLVLDRLASQGTRQIRMQERWGNFKNELKKIQNDKKCVKNSAWLTKSQKIIETSG